MENYLQNLDIWCWRYLENQRNYPGLHLTGKPPACDAVLRCLDQLRREGDGARRTIPLRQLDPADEAKITGGHRYVCFQRLRLGLHAESEELQQYAFRADGDLVRIDLTERHLGDFEQGIQDIRAGVGDYALTPRDEPRQNRVLGRLDRKSEDLWFWPCFGHLWVVK